MRHAIQAIAFATAIALHTSPALAQADPLAPVPIWEYFNTAVGDYFLATPQEAEIIDAGRVGPGWERTGRYFYVESLAYTFYGTNLCRFYGSANPGPNSHFFTLDPGECNYLKAVQATTPNNVPHWNYEGLTFAAGVPHNGSCATSTPYNRPVYRLFSNGQGPGTDAHHRYVTDPADVDAMIGLGWMLEGVVFCALNRT